MWKRLRITFVFILFVLFSLLVSSCFLSSASAATLPDGNQPSVTLTYQEYKQLSDNLTMLQSNSAKQLERIVQLETLLNEASNSTSQSNTALIEAQNQLKTAKQQISEQQLKLQKLNALLQTQSEQLSRANASLEIANQSLRELESELKKKQADDRRNKVLAIVASATAVYLATK